MTPITSIVIATRNRPARLAECLEHLAGLDYPRGQFEVIVVDDGSEQALDSTVAPYLESLQLTLLARPPGGPARARNAGAAEAAGRFLAFTDDDCRPDPGWLGALVARLEATPGVVVGGRVVNGLPANAWSSASQLLCDYLYRYYNPDPDAARFFTSNNLAIPTDRFDGVGGFNPSYSLPAGEDRDLCDRLLGSGTRLVFEPTAVVIHAHALDARRFLRQHFRYGRGARRFRRQRAGTAGRAEPIGFYTGLLAAPFSSGHGLREVQLSGLLALAQLANAAGFLTELVRPGGASAQRASRT